MGDPDTAGRFSNRLIEEGVFAQPVVFPTVAIDQLAAPHDRHGRPRRRAARPGARGVRPGRPRAGPHRRVSRRHGDLRDDRAGRDLPLDAHLHTDLSPDSDVPIDVYAAAGGRARIAELAITDHVDFEPGAPAFGYSTFDDRERIVRDAAERWAPQGVTIRFGVELTYDRAWEADIRDHLARHPTTSRSARSTIASDRRTPRRASRRWVAGRSLAEIVAPVLRRGRGGGAVRALRHDRPYRRRQALPAPARAAGAAGGQPELYEPILRALVESGTALEVNTSGLRHGPAETYPSARDRRPVPRARRGAADHRLGRPSGEALRLGARRRLRGRALGRLRAPRRPRRASAPLPVALGYGPWTSRSSAPDPRTRTAPGRPARPIS